MNIYQFQEAFGAADKTSKAMRQAISQWHSMYYQQPETADSFPCQRIPYTLVNKITKAVFGEYQSRCSDPVAEQWLRSLEQIRREAMQLSLMGGSCYIKPCPTQAGFSYTLIPRKNVLIFGRDSRGVPTDVGTAERSTEGNFYYTLLERRKLEGNGMLRMENRLYRSRDPQKLGSETSLKELARYADLPKSWRYPLGSVGLVQMRTPMVNCVDGSGDAVAVFAPAIQLIQAIDRNERQLMAEFDRGESRIIVSRDLLDPEKNLTDHLFVGLDEDPEQVGITLFSPNLREQSFLARKQEYLRNVESIIGLKRGMLSDANMEERTATEIAASSAEYALTVMDFQQMWEQAARETVALCRELAILYGLPAGEEPQLSFEWGNGVLYDQEKVWADYMDLVARGLLKPEIALGWRFGEEAKTPQQQAAIRQRWMPNKEEV